jgi:lysophospholipase L1-like esterase
MTWGLWTGLAISVALNVGLFQAAKTFYTREAKVRLHPIGVPSFKESGPEGAPRVLLLGDSRCAQWPDLALRQYRVINGGVGNETTAQIQLRSAEALATARPAIVIVEAGINDLKAIPLLPERESEIVHDCVANLMRLVRASRDAGASVVVLSVLPAGRVELSRQLVWSDAVARSVVEVNRLLLEQCSSHSRVLFLDVTSHISVDRDYKDTLHFNPDFYARISPIVEKVVDEMVNSVCHE